jgi:hypothetical protein
VPWEPAQRSGLATQAKPAVAAGYLIKSTVRWTSEGVVAVIKRQLIYEFLTNHLGLLITLIKAN